MNHSVDEPNRGHDAPPLLGEEALDELFGEFEALLYRFVRLIGPRHEEAGDLLPVPQYMVLRTLGRAGPMRVSDVASALGVKNPAASMLLQAVAEEGWVERREDPEDRRATLVSLTTPGAERLELAEEQRRDFMHRVTSRLSRQELENLVSSLNVILDTAQELGPS